MSSGNAIKHNRAAFPKSATATAVSRLTTRAPFASTLRPNLTGGALSRTSGGYSLGGGRLNGARYFSHTPAAPAQVIHNASIAVRAFWLSGQKAQFDGVTAGGEKRYRTISNIQDETIRKINSLPRNAPGSYIDFHLNPTITAFFAPCTGFPVGDYVQQVPGLEDEGFLDVFEDDLKRAAKGYKVILKDIKRLSTLGNLPRSLEKNGVFRVRFPGCDAEAVERLCDEVGVQRGIIHEDSDFNDRVGGHVALMFPFAPTREHTLSSPGGSLRTQAGHDYGDIEYALSSIGESLRSQIGQDYEEVEEDMLDNPWQSGYASMEESSETESLYFAKQSEHPSSSQYEGVEGIIRFIEQCENARRAP